MKQILMILGCLLLTGCASQATPKDWQFTTGQPAMQAREQWQKLTSGEELAKSKMVQFYPPPNYGLTTDANDSHDLTDGTLSSRMDDRIWFNKDAVGWRAGVGKVLMVIDLGSEQPIGQIAIRVLGGSEQKTLSLPKGIEFLASNDGQQYYSLQNMVKLNPGEMEQADFVTSYYISEEGKAFMTPLVCRQAVRARYIALRLTPANSVYTDQISILKADASASPKSLQAFPKAQVFTDGIAVMPRHESFVVTTNILTPNWLTVIDNTNLDLSKNEAGFRLELPDGLHVLKPQFTAVKSSRPGMRGYEFRFTDKTSIGALWVEKDANAVIPADAKIILTGMVNGKESHVLQFPLQLVKIPETQPIKGLDVSLAWMSDSVEQQWPDFLRDFRKMGFNDVSTFPRNFGKDTSKHLAFLKQARALGYGVIYNESPFHVMWKKVQKDQKAGRIDAAEAEKLYTQINGKRGQWMNMLYRGKYFQNEINRIAKLAALVQPDHVYMDIEWWKHSVSESQKDPRVVAAWKNSGKSWDDFTTDMGAEVLDGLVSAMRQSAPARKLTVGLYNSDPTNAIYDSFFAWKKIYPGIVDIAMPSLYVQGRPLLVANRVRHDYDAMQSRNIIPWLTAGTYGEFDPKFMEPMVLESILNGARDVTYYKFENFDPMDFYYHAKAIADLAPYEKLLQSGKPVVYKGDNPALHYTCFANANEALLLVGNYNNSSQTKVNLPLPISSATKVLLKGKPLAMKNKTISIDVPPGEFRLIYVENAQ